MDNIRKNWEKFGGKDPYYWVTTDSEYRDSELTENTKKKFFNNADNYLESIFKIIKKHINPEFFPKHALDFGCGVGRVAIPLANRCRYVLGVDIAGSMIEEAENNKAKYMLDNIDFSTWTDKVGEEAGFFDFMHSIYVFQHIRTKQGLSIFGQLVDRLKENGIGVFHFITFQEPKPIRKKIIYWLCVNYPLFNALNNIRTGKPFTEPIYEMNNYSLNILFEILREKKCHHIYVRHTKEGHYHGVILFFQKKCENNDNFISLGDIP